MTDASREDEKQPGQGSSDPAIPKKPESVRDDAAPGSMDLEKSRGSSDDPPQSPNVADEPIEDGEDANPRRRDLDRVRTAATATSLTSTAAPTTRLPEQKPWYKQPNPLRWGKIPPVPKERQVCPEYKAGFLSKLFFQWMAPLMSSGYKRPLEVNDIYAINPDRAVQPLTDKLRASFRRRVDAGEKFPLAWAINEAFFWDFWLGGFCALLSTVLQVMSPFVLRYLIQFAADAWVARLRHEPGPDIGHGIGLVIGVTAMQVVQSLSVNQFIYRGMVVGGMARASLVDLIYQKSMVISGRAKAGGAELPDIPAVRAAEKQRLKDEARRAKRMKKSTTINQTGLKGDGVGWDNGRIVSEAFFYPHGL
jgi:ATP-binding cassette subfamily C (CFTR/MRP) protein 1